MSESAIISVTHDNEEKDFPMTVCFKRVDDENTKLLVGYVGDDATELYRCVTEQDYLKEHNVKVRAYERVKAIDECMVAMNELAVKWFNQGRIALGDIPRLAEQLKEQNNES